jgi:ADP-heptose:LPS heptosyltransferase
MGISWMHGEQPRPPIERLLLLAPLPIGDTLFITPTIHELRTSFPRMHMTALVHESTADLMRCVPGVDAVEILPVGADWQGGGSLIRTLMRLHADGFDAVIDFSSPAYKWIGFLCGIPLRTYMKFEPHWWFIQGEHTRWRMTHATEHYYNCARELGLPPWAEADHRLRLRLPESAREAACTYLHGLRAKRHSGWEPLVAIHAGGTMLDGVKRWPAERFAETADALCDRWGASVLLLGGPEDQVLARSVAATMRTDARVVAGEVSLLTSLALVDLADLFVGNDSGLLHAAAALGTPYLGIYGPTSLPNFQPTPLYAEQGRLALPPRPCPEPQYFVGGDVVWRRRHLHCHETCAALLTLSATYVISLAESLLRVRLSSAGAV